MRCCTVLREPAALADLYLQQQQEEGEARSTAILQIMAASWGHTHDPELAISVRDELQALVDCNGSQDKLQVHRVTLDEMR